MASKVDVMVYDFMNCKKNSYPHLTLENMEIFKKQQQQHKICKICRDSWPPIEHEHQGIFCTSC